MKIWKKRKRELGQKWFGNPNAIKPKGKEHFRKVCVIMRGKQVRKKKL